MSGQRLYGGVAVVLWLLTACASGRAAGSHTSSPTAGVSISTPMAVPVRTPGNEFPGGGLAQTATPRFFFAGNGRLTLQHAHFNTTLDVQYRKADGSYDAEALAQISAFFRSREDGRQGHISLRLIELLAYVQNRYHPREMILVSGYRSPEFNENLRAAGGAQAQTSLHTQGLAADVALSGLNLKRTWQALRALHTGGVGYYRSGNFLHLDTGAPRFWEESTSRVKENLSADNARMFARTDFDRYTSVDGALVDLYSITAFPVRIASEATLSGTGGGTPLALTPVENASIDQRDGCFEIKAPAPAYQFRVHASSPVPRGRATVMLHTCEPRIGQTPGQVVSNTIEVGS